LFGIDRKTVSKILKHSVPPGLSPLEASGAAEARPVHSDHRPDPGGRQSQLKKQRHTAKRIFERLRDEHGFTGGITIVTDYVREKKRRTREVFVPLSHPPGTPRSISARRLA
jgi:hypothetical protein